jgi:hypothetical protein
MASSYTVSWEGFWGGPDGGETIKVKYDITAHTDGTVTDISTDTDKIADGRTVTELIKGRNFKMIESLPTSGGTAPAAANVTVKNANGLDLLNGNGTSLIHATAAQAAYPMIDGQPATIPVPGALTIGVSTMTNNGSDETLILTFV